jgi:hypothetical protein
MSTVNRNALMLLVIVCLVAMGPGAGYAGDYSIGVFYYPGWRSDYINWKDIKGLQGSRSPGKPWPDREPLLGYYPEEEPWVAEKHIEWASRYGVNFFAYDWYWNDKQPEYDHALKNYLKATNRDKLQFCLLWAYHIARLKDPQEFDAMVLYWINNYFNQPTYYRIMDKPVIFIFDVNEVDTNARNMRESTKSLLTRADALAREKGYKGIFFVATTNEKPADSVEHRLGSQGFNGYTGWNYVVSQDTSRSADYNSMVSTYLDFYKAAETTFHALPYIVPASPGWDARPWHGENTYVRSEPTPGKFERMLIGAKKLLDGQKGSPRVLMIESWNEFGEGSYIEPTKKTGFGYLETIQKVFSSGTATRGK